MTTHTSTPSTPDRSQFHFAGKVRGAFRFLTDRGFAEIEALPTLVRYRRGDVEVDVYHGRQSYEVGAGISVSGNRFAMSEIVRVTNPIAAKGFRNAVATTPDGLTAGLEKLSALLRSYGTAALEGDPEFLSTLERQRREWSDEYALEVLAAQLRPRADDAFRRGDYSTAAELYGRIRRCLSAAEIKKLTLAEVRSKE